MNPKMKPSFRGAILWLSLFCLLLLPACKKNKEEEKQLEQEHAASYQKEAAASLKCILDAQTAYFEKKGRYAPSFDALGLKEPCSTPDGVSRYTYYLPEQALRPQAGPRLPPPEGLKPFAVGNEWQAIAVANLDSDDTIDIWTVDNTGLIGNVINDVEE